MYGQLLTRAGLGDVMSGRGARKDNGLVAEFRARDQLIGARFQKDLALAVWPGEFADDLPVMLVLDELSEVDAVSWITTYAPSVRPFTSHCRIVSSEFADIFLKSPSTAPERARHHAAW